MYKPQCLTSVNKHQNYSPVTLCKDTSGVFWSNVMLISAFCYFNLRRLKNICTTD